LRATIEAGGPPFRARDGASFLDRLLRPWLPNRPMTIDLNCQQCDASFEEEITSVLEGEPIVCPNCGQRAPRKAVEEFGNALDELFAKVADLRPRFQLALTVESDDLPPPYDEEEPEDEDEDEDLDEDDVDEDDEELYDDEDER